LVAVDDGAAAAVWARAVVLELAGSEELPDEITEAEPELIGPSGVIEADPWRGAAPDLVAGGAAPGAGAPVVPGTGVPSTGAVLPGAGAGDESGPSGGAAEPVLPGAGTAVVEAGGTTGPASDADTESDDGAGAGNVAAVEAHSFTVTVTVSPRPKRARTLRAETVPAVATSRATPWKMEVDRILMMRTCDGN